MGQESIRIEMVIPVTREFQLRSRSVAGWVGILGGLTVQVKCHHSNPKSEESNYIGQSNAMLLMMMIPRQRPPYNRFNCESISFAIITGRALNDDEEE